MPRFSGISRIFKPRVIFDCGYYGHYDGESAAVPY